MSFADIVRARQPRTRRDNGAFTWQPEGWHRSQRAPDPRLNHVTRRLHPSFDWPHTSRDVILESSDGVNFYADLNLLSVDSPFFAHLAEVPAMHPHGHFHHTIPLPSARSFGIEIFLLAVQYSEAYPFPSIPRGNLLYGILDALDMADPYDIPMFTVLTPAMLMGTFKDWPFLHFAMAAAIGDERIAVVASRRTLPLHLIDMPREAADLLLERAPAYHARLQYLHIEVRPRILSFRQALVINEEIQGTMRFDDLCLSQGCPAVRMVQGDFQALRTMVAKVLLRSFGGRADAWNDKTTMDAICKMLGCQRCGGRIGRGVIGAVGKHSNALSLKDSI